MKFFMCCFRHFFFRLLAFASVASLPCNVFEAMQLMCSSSSALFRFAEKISLVLTVFGLS